MINTGLVQRKQLEDLWEDNTKQGRHLVNGIKGHHSRCDLHKQAWNDYGHLAEECNNLEQEARQELENLPLF